MDSGYSLLVIYLHIFSAAWYTNWCLHRGVGVGIVSLLHWRPVLCNAGCNSAWKVLLTTLQVTLLHPQYTQELLLLVEFLYTLSPSRYMTGHLTSSLHGRHMQQAKGTFRDSTYVQACSFFNAEGDNSLLLCNGTTHTMTAVFFARFRHYDYQ